MTCDKNFALSGFSWLALSVVVLYRLTDSTICSLFLGLRAGHLTCYLLGTYEKLDNLLGGLWAEKVPLPVPLPETPDAILVH